MKAKQDLMADFRVSYFSFIDLITFPWSLYYKNFEEIYIHRKILLEKGEQICQDLSLL